MEVCVLPSFALLLLLSLFAILVGIMYQLFDGHFMHMPFILFTNLSLLLDISCICSSFLPLYIGSLIHMIENSM